LLNTQAKVSYLFLSGLRLECEAGAFDRLLAAAAVQQSFTQSAVAIANLVLGNFALDEIAAECGDRVEPRSAGERNGGYRLINLGNVVHCARLSGGAGC
jgi:hypothetical protein